VKTTSTAAAPRPDAAAGPYRITDREFSLFQELVQRESGIQLPEAKRLLLVGRLARRLRALRLDTFEAYSPAGGRGRQRVGMIDLVSTNRPFASPPVRFLEAACCRPGRPVERQRPCPGPGTPA
jgi:hypothetical protein